MSESLNFMPNAVSKVWELIQEEGNFSLKLRVYVTGGGCSGFQYGFTFDEQINDDDIVITKLVKSGRDVIEAGKSAVSVAEAEGIISESDTSASGEVTKDGKEGETGDGEGTVQLLIDPMSFQYLVGSEIDYKEDIEGAQFIIRNPNAKTTCGCGSSFSA